MSSTLSLPARLLGGLIRVLPVRVVLGLASGLGSAWYLLSPGRRRIADANLRIAFGEDLQPRERARIARASFRGLARVFPELAVMGRVLGNPARAKARLQYHGDWEALVADGAAGRAGLIVTGHLGNWEVGAIAFRRKGIPLRVMARPLDSPTLEALVREWRGGAEAVIPKVGGLTDVLRRLRAGDWIALVADQNAGRHGLFVPFFGLEASTFPTPVALAQRFGVPVYLGACLRRPGRPCSFDVHIRRLDLQRIPVESGIRAINSQLEEWIRSAPGQYNWVHRRWKTRPPGRTEDEPGRPPYARSWPMTPEGTPLYGREVQ